MHTFTKLSLVAVMAIMLCGGSALADDVMPPPWRGQERTVQATWDSFNGFPGMPADSITAPGLTNPTAYLSCGDNSQLLSNYEGRTNVIDLDSQDNLTFTLSNFDDGPEKTIWMQVTYFGDANYVPVIDLTTPGTLIPPEYVDTIPPTDPFTNLWRTQVFYWKIQPNPSFETFDLHFVDNQDNRRGMFIDQIVVDTICPEPTALGLLALGGMVLLRKRRS